MKGTHYLPILAACSLLLGCGADTPEISSAGWQISKAEGLSIKVPTTWKPFVLKTMDDLTKAKSYAADKPDLKKLVDQIGSVQQVKFIALDPVNGIGMNATRSDTVFRNLTTEQLKERMVAASKDSFPWLGLPAAGIVEFPAGKAVLIEGTLAPAKTGENQHVEQYAFNGPDGMYTIAFICPESKASVVNQYAHPILNTLTFP